MAESSFNRLGPGMGVTPATVARVGGGWGISGSHAVADDPKLHPPLAMPGGNPPAPYVPPPPQPTEGEHRGALAEALEAKRRADEVATKAAEAHDRALALVEQRRTELAGYASLDDDRFARTLDSLRDDDGSVTLPGTDDRLIRREEDRVRRLWEEQQRQSA
jgi:hypothetical protein